MKRSPKPYNGGEQQIRRHYRVAALSIFGQLRSCKKSEEMGERASNVDLAGAGSRSLWREGTQTDVPT